MIPLSLVTLVMCNIALQKQLAEKNTGDITITEVDKREPQGGKRRKEKLEWNDSIRKRKGTEEKNMWEREETRHSKHFGSTGDNSDQEKVSGINFTSGDMRGRHHMRPTKNSIERGALKAHIESFPTVESHYCRHNTQRRYHEADLSLHMMHRLYAESRPNALSLTSYKTIFCTEYNLGFHKPKKDVYDFCSTHLQATKVDPNTNQEA
ncbi:hypothetical protein PoB_007420400 [Plakobranchus ocellatus]|uniref:Uncharacterized protein n=1 Tax=Plakobranchus ocellatus TaxID=259542 RepID=A0AAV4DUL0_9GAST|nr:hypothetical protein PoB_007420400 [Plakobranchus ocellatus]